MKLSRGLLVVAMILTTACQAGAPVSETADKGWQGSGIEKAASPEQIATGKRIAEETCASCHAIDRTSISPKQDAPPLREVLALYDQDNLAYRLIEGMRVGHDGMPHFDFDVRAADALLAYIASLGK